MKMTAQTGGLPGQVCLLGFMRRSFLTLPSFQHTNGIIYGSLTDVVDLVELAPLRLIRYQPQLLLFARDLACDLCGDDFES
jgi:hypothetical protein